MSDRYLPVSDDPDRFLECSGPRKICFIEFKGCLRQAGVQTADVHCYGSKTAWRYLEWLDIVVALIVYVQRLWMSDTSVVPVPVTTST